MNKYEEKRQARIDRLKEAADRAEKMASDTYDSARKMSEAIPFGQPIIVGHHSEQSDRNYRKRISDKFESSFREQSKADELRAKADAAENNTGISSDGKAIVNKEINRIQFFFDGKPDEETRDVLPICQFIFYDCNYHCDKC